jgi:LPXTG-motif cell wall-anchored protein
VRRILAVVALAAALAMGGMGLAGTAPAGAGGFTCTYTVSPTTLGPNGGVVTVRGTAPAQSVVRVFAGQVQVAVVPSDPATGAFETSVTVTQSVEITVGVDDYPTTPCRGAGNDGANVAGANVAGAAGGVGRGRGALPRTGSSSTSAYVLGGLAAVALGSVLVVGARRFGTIRGRG